ncbi:unnamed protein product [Fraxinus pennsylvanica]|uniref:Uncharacterized protein n=1 Tax=Fraxinus pennsylvanica TaxID=56036 RepID=A0AAD1Z6T6_9LAMI|nr:unnamed protein product [Fraxinus pennsylvanica]
MILLLASLLCGNTISYHEGSQDVLPVRVRVIQRVDVSAGKEKYIILSTFPKRPTGEEINDAFEGKTRNEATRATRIWLLKWQYSEPKKQTSTKKCTMCPYQSIRHNESVSRASIWENRRTSWGLFRMLL